MSAHTRPLHLDHAATSWPKAPGVTAAIARWFEQLGVSADRGDSDVHRIVGTEVSRVRSALAALAGVPPTHCAFTSGATESLNLLLRAVVRPRQRVVTTAIEHSSVVRPLLHLRTALGFDLEVVPCDAHGGVDPQAVITALRRSHTDLCVLAHASNVTGAVIEAAPILDAARSSGTLSILDASQTIGVIDVACGADFVVASAHKSLLGPPGLGFVLAREGVVVAPPKQGGSGSSRALELHPTGWPSCFEAGTPNTPAILGLGAALDWLTGQDRQAARSRSIDAIDRCWDRLASSSHHRRHSPTDSPRLPILSFSSSRYDTAELGALLDASGIGVRVGHHCAPWIHWHLGTEASGTVRVSPGPFVSADEVLRVADALGC